MDKKLFMEITQQCNATAKLSRAEMDQLQEDKFRKLLKHAAENSPYYKEVLKPFDLATVPITELPTLTKSALMDHFDEVVTNDALKFDEIKAWMDDPAMLGTLYKNRWIAFKTSGTTGRPAVIVTELSDNYYNHAVGNRTPFRSPSIFHTIKLIVKGLFKPWSLALVTNNIGHASSGYVSSLYAPKLPPYLKFEYLNSLEPISTLVEKLNKIQPIAIHGTPFMLDALASQQLAGNLKLQFDSPFSRVTTGGEVLYPKTREKVYEAWGLNILCSYGATECGAVARNACDYEHLHVMSDMCILEVVDNDNNPVPDGEYGDKVLLTNLNNYAQPLIRYEIADVVAYQDPDYEHHCHLPFPLLKGIKGRYDHHFIFEDLESGKHYSFRHEYFLLLDDIEAIDRYRFVQKGQNSFELSYTLSKAFEADPAGGRQQIVENFEKLKLPVPIKVEYKQVDKIELTQSGKANMFENQYKTQKDFES